MALFICRFDMLINTQFVKYETINLIKSKYQASRKANPSNTILVKSSDMLNKTEFIIFEYVILNIQI